MSTSLHEIEAQARELSESERARLALSLIESLESHDDGDIAEGWRIELDRRWAEVESGAAVTASASEVFSEVRRALK